MMAVIRFFIGLCLIPLCVAAAATIVELLGVITPSESGMTLAGASTVGGFLAWLLVYFVLPRPVRSYVLAHELTHALWGSLMGARIFKIRVAEDRGSVTLSGNNFLITLAPYFFPFYTVLVLAAFGIVSLFRDMAPYYPAWLAAVGFTWGFHFTFTLATLMQHQTDIRHYGFLFSYAWILLLNAVGIGLWLVAVSPATLEQFVSAFGAHTADAVSALAAWLRIGWAALGRQLQ